MSFSLLSSFMENLPKIEWYVDAVPFVKYIIAYGSDLRKLAAKEYWILRKPKRKPRIRRGEGAKEGFQEILLRFRQESQDDEGVRSELHC